MKISFDKFIKNCYPSLYQWQREALKHILTLKEPFNMHTIMLKQRQNERAFMRRIDLHWKLLNNKSVYDASLRLHYHFITNTEGETELVIDQYSQPRRTDTFIIMDDLGDGNMPEVVFNKVVKPDLQSFTELMKEVDEVIKGIT